MSNGYSTTSIGKLLNHFTKHEPLSYLPYHLVKPRAILPENMRNGELAFVRYNQTRKARQAIQMFTTKIQDLEFLNVGFTPVKVEIGGKTFNSEMTDYYRSFALFDKYHQMDWDILCNREPLAKIFIERLLRLGNSKGAEVVPFFERKSPLHDGYEVMTFVKKLTRFPRRSANHGAE